MKNCCILLVAFTVVLMMHGLTNTKLNPLNAELYPIYHLLALLEAHHIIHISRIRVNVCAASHAP